MKKRMLFGLMIFLLISCDSEEGLKEQTKIQSQEEIQAQNQNLIDWSDQLEKDLEKRRLFIGAVAGEFEGEITVKQFRFSIRIKVASTIPDYQTDRVRTLAELEYEIQNLALNIHVIQWNPDLNMSAVGCVIENIRPDFKKGILNIISESCSNSYSLFLANDEGAASTEEIGVNLADQIRNGEINYIHMLKGKFQSSNNAKVYEFTLNRI